MKKVIFFIALILISVIAMGQTAQATKVSEQPQKETKVVKVDDKTFKVTSTSTNASSSDSSYQPTGYYYQLKSGEKREIYTHTLTKGPNKGKTFCYIKTPKGGWSKIKITPEELKS